MFCDCLIVFPDLLFSQTINFNFFPSFPAIAKCLTGYAVGKSSPIQCRLISPFTTPTGFWHQTDIDFDQLFSDIFLLKKALSVRILKLLLWLQLLS